MKKRKVEKDDEIFKLVLKICDEVDKDPKVREEAEEYQKRYGTLTEKELRRVITI